MDIETEIHDLKRRVGELEGSFAFLLAQVRAVHKDLLEFRQEVKDRFDRMDERFDRMDERFGRMDEKFGRMDERFGRMDERFGRMDERFGRMDERFDRLENALPGLIAAGVAEGLRR